MSLSIVVIALLIGDPIHSALEGMIGAVTIMKSACYGLLNKSKTPGHCEFPLTNPHSDMMLGFVP